MKTTFRWLGLTLAVLASVGLILAPMSSADAAAGGGHQVTIRTYDVVIESFRSDPVLYRQLKAKVARLTPAQAKKVRAETRRFETRVKRAGQRVSDSAQPQVTEFSAQQRTKITVTKEPTWLERWEAWIKAFQGALPFVVLFFPAVAAVGPVVVFILAIITALSGVARAYDTYRNPAAAAK